jgi:hypothetical protein
MKLLVDKNNIYTLIKLELLNVEPNNRNQQA